MSTARVPMASSLSTCITSSKGPEFESTDIDSEQAHQESASILNVLRTPTPADIIESVDSICRDSADTQYMLIQTNLSKSPKQLTFKPL